MSDDIISPVIIPLTATPSQETSCTLAGLSCRLWVRQLATGMYLDLWVESHLTLAGCLARDRVDMVQNPASCFAGTLLFADQYGTQDPDYTGLGGRFLLLFTGKETQ